MELDIITALTLKEGAIGIEVTGNIIVCRKMGNIIFGTIGDKTAKLSFALQKKNLGDQFNEFKVKQQYYDTFTLVGDITGGKNGTTTLDVSKIIYGAALISEHMMVDVIQEDKVKDLVKEPHDNKRMKIIESCYTEEMLNTMNEEVKNG